MKMYLSVLVDAATQNVQDIAFDVSEGATVGDVARAVLQSEDSDLPFDENVSLAIERNAVLSPTAQITTSGVRSGQRARLLSVAPPVPATSGILGGPAGNLNPGNTPSATGIQPTAGEPTLTVIDAAGQPVATFILSQGENTIGRGTGSTVCVDDASLSRSHFRIVVGADTTITDLGSSNGTLLGQTPLRGAQSLQNGSQIIAGTVRFVVSLGTLGTAGSPAPTTTTIPNKNEGPVLYFNRPPRTEPRYPGRHFKAPEPPTRPEPEPFGWANTMVPVLMAGALFAVTKTFASLLFGFLSPAMFIGSWWQSKTNAKKKYAALLVRYREDVTDLVQDIEQEQITEIAARRLQAPETPTLIQQALNRKPDLWIRGLDDPDFLLVRVGQGDQPSVVTVEIPDGGEREERAAVETLPGRYGIVADVPVEADLRTGGIGFAGPSNSRNAAIRSLLAQIAALHSPAELAIAGIFSEEQAKEWEWLKWLPHTRFPISPVAGDHLGATPSSCADLLRRLSNMIVERSGDKTEGSPQLASWVVLLVDERAHIDRPTLDAILRAGPSVRLTFIWISELPTELPRLSHTVVTVDQANPVLSYSVTGSGSVQRGIRADYLTAAAAENYARGLAPVQDISARTAAELDLPPVVLLSELLGGEAILTNYERIHDRWRANGERTKTLDTPIGQSPGTEFSVDIVRQGPHGFLIGTTGSGKSELLRTLLVSLGASYGPERVNFLLIDFKGGAALKPFLELPHTIGLVTNLREGEANADKKLEAKVKRTIVWLRAELQRRMGILDQFGVSDIADMEKKRAPETPPRLIIVADEFAVLANRGSATGDDVIDEIVNIARLGRSLGIHLLLATQRAGGVITDNIRANTNLRIALRVQDVGESMDVVGAKDAALISLATPGRAFVSIGAGNLTQLQTASSTGHTSALRLFPKVQADPFTFIGKNPTAKSPPVLPSGSGPNDLELLTASINQAAENWPIQQPDNHWVDPPADVVPLDDVVDSTDPFVLSLGLLDEPSAQTVRTASIDLRSVGHLLVFGTGGSGKTVLLRTAAASLARRLSPDDLHIYGLDCAGRGLSPLASLPQTSVVASSEDVEMVYRLFRELRQTITRRTERFAELGVADLSEYRNAYPTGPDRHIALVLLDGLAGFLEKFDKIEVGLLIDRLGLLLVDARPAGVHFLLTTNRRGGIPAAIVSAIQQTIILKMATADEYGSVDIRPADIPIEPPAGRGLFNMFTFQAAMVVSETDQIELSKASQSFDDDAFDAAAERSKTGEAQIASYAAFGQHLAKQWPDSQVSLERLPDELFADRVLGNLRPWEACIGLGDSNLDRVTVSLDETHLVITSPPRGGKSTALAQIAGTMQHGTPGLQAILIGTRRSPASESSFWKSVILNDVDATATLQTLTETIVSGQSIPPTLVCFDDFTDLEDNTTADAFTALFNASKKGAPVRFILSSEPKALLSNWNDGSRALRRFRTGLLIQPDIDTDPDIVNSRLPRQLWRTFVPGRGYLIQGAAFELVQVAIPNVSETDNAA
jgi:DNA segregation ATPase FtsK/SpoIIIE, S-DNA-T family